MPLFQGKTFVTPRVFCIGCNYEAHIKEMNGSIPNDCVIFMKPSTALVNPNEVLYLPWNRGEVHYETEFVVRIGKRGKHISKENALQHIDAWTLGFDLTIRTLQNKFKREGHPWELCKSFDQSAPIGEFIPIGNKDIQNTTFVGRVNSSVVQEGCTKDMIYPIDQLVSILSQTWELLEGDVIFTGTPPGIGKLCSGDILEAEADKAGCFRWTVM